MIHEVNERYPKAVTGSHNIFEPVSIIQPPTINKEVSISGERTSRISSGRSSRIKADYKSSNKSRDLSKTGRKRAADFIKQNESSDSIDSKASNLAIPTKKRGTRGSVILKDENPIKRAGTLGEGTKETGSSSHRNITDSNKPLGKVQSNTLESPNLKVKPPSQSKDFFKLGIKAVENSQSTQLPSSRVRFNEEASRSKATLLPKETSKTSLPRKLPPISMKK